MFRKLVICGLGIWVLNGTVGLAETNPTAIIRAFVSQRDQIQNLEADVNTTLTSPFFTQAQVQRSHLYQKGTAYRRMDFLSPQKSTVITNPKEFIEIDEIGSVNRMPRDDSQENDDWMLMSGPDEILRKVEFSVLREDPGQLVLRGIPQGTEDMGFDLMEATFKTDPVLLMQLDLYNHDRRYLTMALGYVSVKDVPVLNSTDLTLEMQPPGMEQSLTLNTHVAYSNIQVNHPIPLSVFDIPD